MSVSSFFLEGVTIFRKFAISYNVEKMIPLQLVIFHFTFTPRCLDRKFRNRAACQRSHSNERHIIHPLSKMLLASREVLKHSITHDIYPHPHPRPTTSTHDPRPTTFSYTLVSIALFRASAMQATRASTTKCSIYTPDALELWPMSPLITST